MNVDHFYSQSFVLGSACLVSMVIFTTGIVCIQRCCTNNYEGLPTNDDFERAKKNAIVKEFNCKTDELANEYAQKIVENSLYGRRESEIDVDERFIQARENVQAICGQKQVSGCMVEIPFTTMDITSSSTM